MEMRIAIAVLVLLVPGCVGPGDDFQDEFAEADACPTKAVGDVPPAPDNVTFGASNTTTHEFWFPANAGLLYGEAALRRELRSGPPDNLTGMVVEIRHESPLDGTGLANPLFCLSAQGNWLAGTNRSIAQNLYRMVVWAEAWSWGPLVLAYQPDDVSVNFDSWVFVNATSWGGGFAAPGRAAME